MKKKGHFQLRRLSCWPAVVCLALLLPVPPASSQSKDQARKEEIKKIESKINQEKEMVEILDTKEKSILFKLSEVQKEIAEKRKLKDDLDREIRMTEAEYDQASHELEDLEVSLGDARKMASRRLVSLYKYAKKGYVRLIVHSGSFDEFRKRIDYVSAVMEKDWKMLESTMQEIGRHKEEISRLRDGQVAAEAKIEKQKLQLLTLEGEIEKKVLYLVNIHKEKAYHELTVRELELAAEELKQTLADIQKEKAYNQQDSLRFSDLKGKLPLPMEGRISRIDNKEISKNRGLKKGIFIEGASDSEVKAVFYGRVDFSGHLKGYGEMIIINHGSRFYSISARLSERYKEKGALVAQGEPIGTGERDRTSDGSRFYFEIREAANNLDPLKWLKVNEDR